MSDNRKKAKFRYCENCCGRKTNAKDGICHQCIVEDYGGDREELYLKTHCGCGKKLTDFQVDYGIVIDWIYGCPTHDYPYNDERIKRSLL